MITTGWRYNFFYLHLLSVTSLTLATFVLVLLTSVTDSKFIVSLLHTQIAYTDKGSDVITLVVCYLYILNILW